MGGGTIRLRTSDFFYSTLGRPLTALVFVVPAFSCATTPQHKVLTRTEKAHLLVEVANGALNEKDPVGALQNLLAAEELDSNFAELHYSMSLAYFAKHDSLTAITEARRAVQLDPKFSAAQNTLGKLLMDSGRYDEAVSPLMTAAKDPIYRDSYKPMTSLGILFYRKGELPKARDYLDLAIRNSPNSACIAYYYRGNLELNTSDFKEAVSDYGMATKRFCANFGEAHLALGMAYEQSRQYALARKKFLDVQSRFPNTKLAEQAVDHLKFLP